MKNITFLSFAVLLILMSCSEDEFDLPNYRIKQIGASHFYYDNTGKITDIAFGRTRTGDSTHFTYENGLITKANCYVYDMFNDYKFAFEQEYTFYRDAKNRVVKIQRPDGSETFYYNEKNQIEMIILGNDTNYLYYRGQDLINHIGYYETTYSDYSDDLNPKYQINQLLGYPYFGEAGLSLHLAGAKSLKGPGINKHWDYRNVFDDQGRAILIAGEVVVAYE